MEIFYDMVLVMKEGSSGKSRAVAACGKHVLSGAILRSMNDFANKFHLCLHLYIYV